MKLNVGKYLIAAALMQSGLICTADGAEELTGEDNEIINEIVATKIKTSGRGDTKAEILKAIDTIFPLITKDNPESSAFIKQLKEQAWKKYSATDKELETQYSVEAEKTFPIYKVGDKISVVFLLHGKSFSVSGSFYRQDAKFVWVGSKKILKANLAGDYVSRFDSDQTKKLRKNYVGQQIQRYHQERDKYFSMLKSSNGDRIDELRGNHKAKKRRMSARKIALQKYQTEVKFRQEKFDAIIKIYAKNKSAALQEMKKAVREYANTPEADNGLNLISEWEKAIEKEKRDRAEAEEKYRKYEEWRESVRRRTGHYPCNACEGRGRGLYGKLDQRTHTWTEPSICNACGGTGLAD